MIDIVLVEPEEPGNIGAVARVMKNFGFSSLVIVNPQCDVFDEQSRNRAKHAQDILKNARTISSIEEGKYHSIIATTGRLGTDYNIVRSPLLPVDLPDHIPEEKTAILFGRESTGLRNEEIEKCDFVVSIPSSPEYTVLNVSHAVAIILYEIYQKRLGKSTDYIIPASKKEKDRVSYLVNEVINAINFPTKSMVETQKIVWKRIIGKAALTHREAAALMGFFRRLSQKKS